MLGEIFDPKAELHIYEHCRPHWSQAGAVVFITFRTHDSIPREVVKRWDREKQEWLLQRGFGSGEHWTVTVESISENYRAEFHRTFNRTRETFLDSCHGRCRDEEIMIRTYKRLAILLALAFALLPLMRASTQESKPADKLTVYPGKVVPLADLLAKEGTRIDADLPVLVLQTEDGKLHPLLKDNGSRMFFKDSKLLNRPMRLTARRIANSDILQVISVKSVVKGKVHEPYYWCDICTIKRYEAGICDCCGAPLDFREDPWKD